MEPVDIDDVSWPKMVLSGSMDSETVPNGEISNPSSNPVPILNPAIDVVSAEKSVAFSRFRRSECSVWM